MLPIKKCLSCKFFRPKDEFTGRCRVDKGRLDQREFPILKHDDLCKHWKDAGQQYYIRVGWVKNLQARQLKSEDSEKE